MDRFNPNTTIATTTTIMTTTTTMTCHMPLDHPTIGSPMTNTNNFWIPWPPKTKTTMTMTTKAAAYFVPWHVILEK
jgi:hypothetical protein